MFYPMEVAFINEHVKMANAAQPLPTKLWAIAPVGGPREGWDECFPPSVGSADAEHGIYWVRDHITAVTFLSPRSKGTHTATDPAEFSNKLHRKPAVKTKQQASEPPRSRTARRQSAPTAR